MNKHFLMFFSFLIFLSFVILSSTGVLALEYVNQELHYKFTLPDRWEEIPKDVLEDFMSKVSEVASLKKMQKPHYVAGFQKSSKQYFTYPYLLIQHLPIDTATISQLAKAMSELDWDETKTALESTNLIRITTIGKPVADTERKMIFVPLEAQYPLVGMVKGLIASVPGRDGIVNIMFYDLKKHFDDVLPEFDSILNSFSFEPGYEYSWLKAKSKFWGPVVPRGMGKAIAGGILAALTALILGLVRRARKKGKV